MKRYYCTLFDKNYLLKGLALYQSLVKHAGDFKLFICCMDLETFEILRQLELPHTILVPLHHVESRLNLQPVRTTRSWLEYCWTMASQFMWYIFIAQDLEAVPMLTYLDADLYFYSSPEPIYNEMGDASIAITPHRFSVGNSRLLVNGVYNVSWLTIRNDDPGLYCLIEWKKNCREWCYHRNEGIKFADQGYLNAWPYDYGSACHVIQHIGAGTAPWNVYRYEACQAQDRDGVFLWVDPRLLPSEEGLQQYPINYPLIFYHFHEFTHDDIGNCTRYTRHPLREQHKHLIYFPYTQAIRESHRIVDEIIQKRAQ